MGQEIPASVLINTKLNPPRSPAELVARPRLYDLLDRRRPLTVIVAPAGYGKSTLMSSWAEHCGMRCAWISLDAGDSKLNVFVEYLLVAIERLFPAIRQRLTAHVRHSAAFSYVAMARILADELDTVDESFVLVLDDYHLVSEPATHRFLTELLRYPPRSLNLVIASRTEPPLKVAVMRVHDQVTEVRALDLRFTAAEMAEYLQHALDRPVDEKSLIILAETTEGWIAGLHLAALFLRNQEDIAGAAARFKGNNRFTIDYLAVEVLARQNADVQGFLLKTSILQRMCPAMCDAVLEEEPAARRSGRLLEQLESDDLFLVTLDDAQQWYRYHPLFQRLLEHSLRATYSPETIAGLYRRASRWCASQRMVDEAVRYALAAGDIANAIALVETNRQTALNEERWQQLEPWLQLLPRREINAHPELLMLEAWILHKRERLAEIPGRLDLAEAMLDEGNWPLGVELRLRSEIDALRSQQYYLRADAMRTCEAARRALAHAPPEYAGVRSAAWFFLTVGRCLVDGVQPALAILAESSRSEPSQHTTVRAKSLIARCFLHWMDADMRQLRQAADELRWLATQYELQESLVWAHYFHGCVFYQQDNLPAAAEGFLAIMNHRQTASSFVFVQGAFGLAAVLHAQGNSDDAQAVVDMILEYVEETSNSAARPAAQACIARFAFAQGKRQDAYRWAANAEHAFRPMPMLGFFALPLALSTILIGQGTPAALSEAEQLLRQMDGFLAATHNRIFRIETLVQTALLHARCNRPEDALAALGEAVAHAQPGDVRRIFLDADPELDGWLGKLELDEVHADFVAQLRRPGVRHALLPPRQGETAGAAPAKVSVEPRLPDLIELLTHREMEVLQLLARRLTNKEIAESLGITTGTVKQHAMKIFRKLGVENRREAITQALTLGFRSDAAHAR